MIDRLFKQVVLLVLGRISVGSLVISEGRRSWTFGSGDPKAIIEVRSSRFWRALLRGSRGLADAYRDGLWDSPNLATITRLGSLNLHRLDSLRRNLAPLRTPLRRLMKFGVSNTRERSRKDISAHYDLGNEMFELMLDETLMYSCAVFDSEETTLEEASLAKIDLICRKLLLNPQDHLLEIGTGWGGFALHAAKRYGCRVTTTTISKEQYEYAIERIAKAGLSGRVKVLLCDYRDLRGQYDKLVSIEMIEAVGWKNFNTFFSCCSHLLKQEGAMLLQAIVVDDRAYELEKDTRTFINTTIFPGSSLPSREEIGRRVAKDTDMRVVSLEDITPHYATTLRLWRERFDSNSQALEQLGYDESFRRLWRLYLAYCEGAFMERRIGGLQVLMAKPQYRDEQALLKAVRTDNEPGLPKLRAA